MKKTVVFLVLALAFAQFAYADTASLKVDFVSSSADVIVSEEPGQSDIAQFQIDFDVTAVDGDIYLDNSCKENGPDVAGQGVEYTLVAKNKNSSVCVFSGLTSEGGDTLTSFIVPEGDTRSFSLTVSVIGSEDHFTKMALVSLNGTTDVTDATPDQFYKNGLGAMSEFVTPTVFVNVN